MSAVVNRRLLLAGLAATPLALLPQSAAAADPGERIEAAFEELAAAMAGMRGSWEVRCVSGAPEQLLVLQQVGGPALRTRRLMCGARDLLNAQRPGHWHVGVNLAAGFGMIVRSDTPWCDDSFDFSGQ